MAQELVITSVRRGLDGGSGYQPVLRTRGMKPALAERLQIRSSYAHPYPHGDKRNPIVFVHRIERIAGQTLHVLGRFCDAGSDHTGRSNFLSHLVVIDETEARRKSAGPADVARRFSYKKTWTDTPREIEPPALIGGDRAPGPCEAWRSAGLDPGLAGDLAEAATNGSEVRLILRTQDDALSLFADALTLVPPARRWSVTFNTCEIESFDAVWRAAREDLSQAKAWRGAAGVIDLTRPGVCGSNGVYARYARGENVTLPWQTQRSAPDNTTLVAESLATVSQAPTSSAAPGATPTRDVPSTPPPRVTSSEPLAGPPLQSPPPTSELPGKRNYLKRVEEEREHRRLREDHVPASTDALRYVIPMLGALLLGVFIAGFVMLQLNPELQMRIATAWRDLAPASSTQPRSNEEDNPNNDSADLGEIARTQREQLQKQEMERQKQKQKEERHRAEQQAQAERDREARLASEMEQKQRDAQAARTQELQERQAKREQAFAALKNLDGTVRQDLPVPGGAIDDRSLDAVDLCAINADNLVGLAFDLAVPDEELPAEGQKFKAWIEPVQGDESAWQILSEPPKVFGPSKTPVHLASLTLRKGLLRLSQKNPAILRSPRFSLLRRSVLLVKATDPQADPSNQKAVVAKSIQLVRPWRIREKSIDPFTTAEPSTLWEFMPAVGPLNDIPAIPESAQMSYEMFFGPQRTALKPHSEDPTFFPLRTVERPFRDRGLVSAEIGIRIDISKLSRSMRISPEICGLAKHAFDIAKIREVISQRNDNIEDIRNNLTRGLQGPINSLASLQPKDFPANKKRLDDFCSKKDFIEFLGGATALREWNDTCEVMVNRSRALLNQVGRDKDTSKPDVPGSGRRWTLQDIQPQLDPINRQWQETYCRKLVDYGEYFIDRRISEIQTDRKDFGSLAVSLAIQIREIAYLVTDGSGNKYPVILAEHGEPSNQAGPAQNKPESGQDATKDLLQ